MKDRIPEKIWLQLLDDGEITWCIEQINEDDVEFVQASIANEQKKMLDAVVGAVSLLASVWLEEAAEIAKKSEDAKSVIESFAYEMQSTVQRAINRVRDEVHA